MKVPQWAMDQLCERATRAMDDYALLPVETKALMPRDSYVNARLDSAPPITWTVGRYQ